MPQPQPLSSRPDQQSVHVTVVESPACHFCADAHQVFAELVDCYPLVVDSVDAGSDAGRLLMARHRAAMSPLVLLDGAFFSHGRLPRRKLSKVLADRYGSQDEAARGGRRG
jgi:hypothetical protein